MLNIECNANALYSVHANALSMQQDNYFAEYSGSYEIAAVANIWSHFFNLDDDDDDDDHDHDEDDDGYDDDYDCKTCKRSKTSLSSWLVAPTRGVSLLLTRLG